MTDFEELEAVVSITRSDEVDPDLTPTCRVIAVISGNWATRRRPTHAFARAAHVTKLDITNNRLIPNALEPRAAIGVYDRSGESFTIYTTSQNPHLARLVLSAFVKIAPEHKLRIVAPDVGGGFGSKIFIYPEEATVAWASRRMGRPVKWTADRSESFLADAHGRDHATHAELALDAQGHFLGLRVKTIANLGAYLSTFASSVPTFLYGTLLAGQYKTPAIYVEVDGVFTNTAPVDAYRGAGRPEATYVVERIVETAAREMKIDPTELRRRNFIQPKDFPYQTPVALRLRHRRLRSEPEQGAGTRRLRRLSGAQSRVCRTRQKTRHRILVLHRSVRARAVEACNGAGCRRRLVRERRGAGESRPVRSRCSPVRTATVRVTKRRLRRSFRTGWAFRSKTSRSCTAIRGASSSASARTARVRLRSAARR